MNLQIQALGEEMEALRNERVVLRRDLQESAEIVSVLAVTLRFEIHRTHLTYCLFLLAVQNISGITSCY